MGGQWAYLHAGGAVSAVELNCPVQVQHPAALRNYRLQLPQSADELVLAVRGSLGLLSLAPDRVSFPRLAAVYRAALGDVDFSLFVAGRRDGCEHRVNAAASRSRVIVEMHGIRRREAKAPLEVERIEDSDYSRVRGGVALPLLVFVIHYVVGDSVTVI